MRSRILWALAIATLLAGCHKSPGGTTGTGSPSPGAQEPEGWGGLTWGMTADQVKKAYPAMAKIEPGSKAATLSHFVDRDGGAGTAEFYLPDIMVLADYHAVAGLHFNKAGQLYCVQISPVKSAKVPSTDVVMSNLDKALHKKYGDSQKYGKPGEDVGLWWRHGNTIIQESQGPVKQLDYISGALQHDDLSHKTVPGL